MPERFGAKVGSIIRTASMSAMPVVVVVVGNLYSQAIKERELEGQFVALAVEVLDNPEVGGRRDIREWAIDVIDQLSGVPLSAQSRIALREGTSLTISSGATQTVDSVAAPRTGRNQTANTVTLITIPEGNRRVVYPDGPAVHVLDVPGASSSLYGSATVCLDESDCNASNAIIVRAGEPLQDSRGSTYPVVVSNIDAPSKTVTFAITGQL